MAFHNGEPLSTPQETLIAQRQRAIQEAIFPLPGSQPYDYFLPVRIPKEAEGLTLYEALSQVVEHLPREYWEEECKQGMLLDALHRPVVGTLVVHAGEQYWHKFVNVTEPAVNGHIRILHEDEALVVVNKPAPLPMHRAGRFYRNTLHFILQRVYQPEQLRQAHRLDANTTGVLIITRTRQSAARLQPQFAAGTVSKRYLVKVWGHPAQTSFSCDAPIGATAIHRGGRTIDWEQGLTAKTDFKVLHRHQDGTALLEAYPLTGRTNQIRLHLWHLGHPVCGDPLYLPEKTLGNVQTLGLKDPPLCLHAWRIQFIHPLHQCPVEFTAPPPDWVPGHSYPGLSGA